MVPYSKFTLFYRNTSLKLWSTGWSTNPSGLLIVVQENLNLEGFEKFKQKSNAFLISHAKSSTWYFERLITVFTLQVIKFKERGRQ